MIDDTRGFEFVHLRRLLLLIASLTAVGYATSRTEPPRPTSSPVASCSASGCHGGTDVGKPGSEVTTWTTGDPHAKAYSVLFNEDSQRIIANLQKGDARKWTEDAHKEKACLACHATGTDACFDGQRVNAASDGVGCDGCHGNSEKWLPRHYEPGWKSLSFKQKLDLGFKDTKELVSRTESCASCHVGDQDRDVNHDLIAAGHPRLAFDYARFHFQPGYKQHWTEKLPGREFEIRSWFIGQVASLRSAVALAQLRRPQLHPEFTEQSCFACHQGLDGGPKAKYGKTPQWQPWHVSLVTVLAAQTPSVFPGAAAPDLAAVDKLETILSRAGTPAVEISTATTAALQVLDAWLASLRAVEQSAPGRSMEGASLRSLAKAIAESATLRSDYDVLATHYLALAALHHADAAAMPGVLPRLEALRRILKYPPGQTGPGAYNADTVKAEFTAIAKSL